MQRFLKQIDIRLILVVVSLLAVGWLQWPRLGDEFRVDEDFRYYYWMYKFQDSALFPSDPSNYYVPLSLPWAEVSITFYGLGFSALFYMSSFIVSPILFSKLLSFILMPITVLYCFHFGQSVRNRTSGIVLAVGFLFINLASSSSVSVTNGVQRSFAATFIIALIYYLHRQKYLPAAVVILLSALIYAPAMALSIGVWGLFWLGLVCRSRPGWQIFQGGLVHLIIVFCLSALTLLPTFAPGLFAKEKPTRNEQQEQLVTQQKDTLVGYKYWWENPKFLMGGTFPVFVIFPLVGRGGLVDLGEDLINLFILLVIAGAIVLVRGPNAFELLDIIWRLLWASLLLFVMAWLIFLITGDFLFHLPSRYTRVGLHLFLLIFVGLNLADFIKEAPTLIRENPKRLVWLIAGIEGVIVALILWYPSNWATISGFNMKWLLAVTGLVFGILGVMLFKQPPPLTAAPLQLTKTLPGKILIGTAIALGLSGWAIYTPLLTEVSYLNPLPAERALLKFIRTLPKDALIAGSPCALDSVQLFARRQVLFSCEAKGSEEIMRQALKAYYTDAPRDITDFCQTYHIDYLVVDTNTYTKDYLSQGWIFYEPYNRELLPYVAAQDAFVLAQMPDNQKLFQAENYFVASCDLFKQAN
jgi:hypothetical protein